MPGHYKLICQGCSKEFIDDGFMLDCRFEHEPSLLMTQYTTKQFKINSHMRGLSRYQEWLPVISSLSGTNQTGIYQSKRLSSLTKLPNLWIAFNGYWPEKGVWFETATFKELEAYTVLARLPERCKDVLVVSSAGSTAAAFASICSQQQFPCLIVIPENSLWRMQFRQALDPCVKVVVLTGNADYYDAIRFAQYIAEYQGFVLEGGVKNVARRDGLGTTLLSAVETIGRLPDYYFQAIGSGAGGIAVHETARKLIKDGRFGQHYPHLMLSQNTPFAPIYDSWKSQQRSFSIGDDHDCRRRIQQIAAQVLSNRKPPYSIKGGVFDTLKESLGCMLTANNDEVFHAIDLFLEAEGIDIDPAAGVAFATLLKEANNNRIDRDALVLLNITGGGWKRKHLGKKLITAQPALRITEEELQVDRTINKVVELF